jgi:pimeloyl-ACP methyl ester carboxylesterase
MTELVISPDLHREAVDGCELRYLRVGSGTPVVLVHTLRTQLEMFLGVIAQLDTTQVEVIAIDLPGHGESTAPRVDYTAGYFTDVVEALLDRLDLRDAVFGGESIGASIGLILAARGNPRIARVVAVNPYDYGRWGGARRGSALDNVVFTTILWPIAGPIVARAGTKRVLQLVLAGGLHDRHKLSPALAAELARCGRLPGHARAFRSLSLQWRSWIAARARYGQIAVPVVLIYGDEDWSRPAEREANARQIPGARLMTLDATGHFASLEQPEAIANLIQVAAATPAESRSAQTDTGSSGAA